MNYSITYIVQKEVDEIWKKKIRETEYELEEVKSAREIRNYLNNRERLNTVSFVIRRIIQKKYHKLLDEISKSLDMGYADLLNGLNLEWPPEFNEQLARKLHDISRRKGIILSTNTWKRYLSNDSCRLNGDSLFRIAFSLEMDIEETEELMLASGHESYCMRNPRHFIYYYCQRRQNSFSWGHAEKLYQDFSTANESTTGCAKVISSTIEIHKVMDYFITSEESDSEVDKELVSFMVTNKKEFSGWSMSRKGDLERMCLYLSYLYPYYIDKKDNIHEVKEKNADGTVTVYLDRLVRALFASDGWLPSTVGYISDNITGKLKRTFSSKKRRIDGSSSKQREYEKNKAYDAPFRESFQIYADHFATHLAAVKRIDTHPDTAQNVDRRDILLLTYFFILKYSLMLQNKKVNKAVLNTLDELSCNDSELDSCMMDIMYMIRLRVAHADKADADHYDYIPIFDSVLQHFTMHSFYLPCPSDRFLYMSLLSNDPEDFTEAVLGNIAVENESNDEEDIETQNTQKYMKQLEDKRPRLLNKMTGDTIDIFTPHFSIGRQISANRNYPRKSPDYQIRNSINGISHVHALIMFDGEKFWLADVSAVFPTTNGNRTRLNGVALQPNGSEMAEESLDELMYKTPLADGDCISIYYETFIFQVS